MPGTEPLKFDGDPAMAMVDGIKQYLLKLTDVPPRPVDSSRERLRYVLERRGPAVASFPEPAPPEVMLDVAPGVVP